MNSYTRIFFDQASNAGASAVATLPDPYTVPDGADIEIRADGSVVILEDVPGEGIQQPPAGPQQPLSPVDFRGFGESLIGAVRDAATPPPTQQQQLPTFDATRYVNEDQSIDMKGLSEGVTKFATEIAQRAAASALAEAEARHGGAVRSYAAEQLADRICREDKLGDVARETIIAKLNGMTPQQIAAMPADSIEMLRDHAARREERKAALTTDLARPGGGGARRENALTLAVPDPKGIGWVGYCKLNDLDPTDRTVIADARRKGILK